MADVKDRIHAQHEGEVTVSGGYVKHQIGEGMKGFFAPYLSVYEALTGMQTQLVKRDAKSGRFTSSRQASRNQETRKRA